MNKKVLLVVNICLLPVFLIVSLTGILQYLFPQYFYLGPVHKPFGIVLFLLIVLHIFLNKAWIKANILRSYKK